MRFRVQLTSTETPGVVVVNVEADDSDAAVAKAIRLTESDRTMADCVGTWQSMDVASLSWEARPPEWQRRTLPALNRNGRTIDPRDPDFHRDAKRNGDYD